jgi:hypothetical protein
MRNTKEALSIAIMTATLAAAVICLPETKSIT